MEAEKIVFICSPYGGKADNIVLAKRFMRMAAGLGFTPFAPHVMLHGVLDDNIPNQRVCGMNMGLLMLTCCRHLWICGEERSSGMDLEIQQAEEAGTIISQVGTPELIAWENKAYGAVRRAMLWHDWNAGASISQLCRCYGLANKQEILSVLNLMVERGEVLRFADRGV